MTSHPMLKDQRPFKLSIVVPAYNEASSLYCVLETLCAIDLPGSTEVVVVDDGSTDGTAAIIDGFVNARLIKAAHARNLGKGAAVRTAIAHATGTHILVFDADNEYDPNDIQSLVEPARRGRWISGDVVPGVDMGNRL